MIYSLSLENVGPAPHMEMEFGSRLNLITGDNGLGKSFLLDTTWWALTRKWPQELNSNLTNGLVARPTEPNQPASIEFELESKSKRVRYKGEYSRKEQAWIGKQGRPWNPGLVIYAQADGGFSVWDPARNYWKTREQAGVPDRPSAFVFSPKEVWEGLDAELEGKRTRVCNGLVQDWVNWIRMGGQYLENIQTVLRNLSPSQQGIDQMSSGSITRLSAFDSRDIPTIRMGMSGEVPILHCSAGLRRVCALAYMLLWAWQEHHFAAKAQGETPTHQMVFLIDEIECHLHPRWQRSILNSLLNLVVGMLPNSTIQIVTATHSPLVLASAEPFFDAEKDAWFDLDLDRDSARVELRKRPFVRLGDVSNWLTSEAFDLKEPRSIEAERAMISALAMYRETAVTPERIHEVDGQLRAVLGDTDPFLSGWSRFLREKLVAK